VSASTKDPIVMETDAYEAYVQVIEDSSKGLLDSKEYVADDPQFTSNAVIPDYVTADHAVIDTISKFMEAQTLVVKLMQNVEKNYVEEVDAKKTEELNKASGKGNGSGEKGG